MVHTHAYTHTHTHTHTSTHTHTLTHTQTLIYALILVQYITYIGLPVTFLPLFHRLINLKKYIKPIIFNKQ